MDGIKKKFSDNTQISLVDLTNNHVATVVHIFAGRRATQRLSSLGITPGTRIKKLSSAPLKGPVQIEVRNTRLAIGRGLAQKILLSK